MAASTAEISGDLIFHNEPTISGRVRQSPNLLEFNIAI